MAITIEAVGDLDKEFVEEFERIKTATKNGLRRAGEKYVKTARESGSYQNQTGNLRNSNSYALHENGQVVDEAIGVPTTADIFRNEPMQGDIMLVAGAGMDYASHVQRKGYDVTDSGQLAAESEARRLFEKD